MAVCICGDSARHLLEGLSDDEYREARPVDADDVFFETPTWQEARDISLSIWGEPGIKADILVREHKDRRQCQPITYHPWAGNLPPRSLMQLPDGRLLTTPWFDLIMESSRLSTPRVSKRIMEMTGIYRMSPKSEDGFVEAEPLILRDALEEYVIASKGLRGAAKVRAALDWSPSRARSPREIDSTLPFTIPNRFGGCGFPMPGLNYKVNLGRRSREMLGQNQAVIDLFWNGIGKTGSPAGVEYLGKRHHQEIGKELTRVNALSFEDIDLHLMANEQLSDARQFLMIAKRVASRIGFRPFGNRWPSVMALQALIDEILSYNK